MVWLYAGGVSLILSDVQFGMISLDWIQMSCKLQTQENTLICETLKTDTSDKDSPLLVLCNGN